MPRTPFVGVKLIFILCSLVLAAPTFLASGMAHAAEEPEIKWKTASRRSRGDVQWTVFVETQKTPGRPAFRIETSFDVVPVVAAATLMQEMVEAGVATTPGETRRVMERFDRGALVHTRIDLPFMFADREIAVRIEHTDDPRTGIHRVEWVDANDLLPPVEEGVLRLASRGYWEFRPATPGRTEATYVTRAEVGGSLPAALGDRLLKGQAVTAVERLGDLLAVRERTHVAGPPPSAGFLPAEAKTP